MQQLHTTMHFPAGFQQIVAPGNNLLCGPSAATSSAEPPYVRVVSLQARPLRTLAARLDFPKAFRYFDRDTRDALSDDVRDCEFFVAKQAVFQSKCDTVHEFASTASGQLSYQHGLFQGCVPVALRSLR